MKGLIYSFLLAAACAAVPISAYIFEFSNHTNEELKVRIHLDGDIPSDRWYEATIGPKSSGDINAMHAFRFGADLGIPIDWAEHWKGGFCLGDIQLQQPLMEKKTIIDDNGNEKVTYERKIEPGTNRKMWNPWRNLTILHIKDEAYDAMVNAGGLLADGLADAAAAVASAATGTPVPSFKVSGIVNAAGTLAAYGKCKTMHLDMVPTVDVPELKGQVFNVVALTKAKG